jgi:hypothetical protein
LRYDADDGSRGNSVVFARIDNPATAGFAASDILLAA